MKLKTCPCCKKQATTKNAIYVGRKLHGKLIALYLNCSSCSSTFTVTGKSVNKQEILANNDEDWRFPSRKLEGNL